MQLFDIYIYIYIYPSHYIYTHLCTCITNTSSYTCQPGGTASEREPREAPTTREEAPRQGLRYRHLRGCGGVEEQRREGLRCRGFIAIDCITH